jgi:peptidoglycan/xylan/chitin deacetylase (PgdA/CDA1 family)
MPNRSSSRFAASFTVDVEQDCPPYLTTCRGMIEGLPRLLDLLAELGIKGTFFTTGEMARRFPTVVRRLVEEGHELGCHGDLHRDFTAITEKEADDEFRASLATLRSFAPVRSFRAPYLSFPVRQLALLPEHGLSFDSSLARYKRGPDHRIQPNVAGVTRVPASVTSSVLRLPNWIRQRWLSRLQPPVVLFVHPWEAVDFRRSNLRWDCRFRTGDRALKCWRDVLINLQRSGAEFQRLDRMVKILPVTALPVHT